MKNTLTVFLMLTLSFTFACTPSTEAQQEVTKEEIVQQKQVPVHEILSKADFKTAMSEEGIVLLDVRRPQEFEAGHIEGAVNVNVLASDFKDQLQALELNPEEKVLVYCKSGVRSGRASKAMEEMGFLQIKDLKGGYLGWVKE